MANKANLPKRVKKANAAQLFASVQSYDKNGNAKVVIVPGTQGKLYHVILRRKPFTTELHLLVNGQMVKAKHTSQVTYHCLSAIQAAADEQGYKVTWTANEKDAHNLSNLGGKVFKVTAFDNPTSVMWGVMREEK